MLINTSCHSVKREILNITYHMGNVSEWGRRFYGLFFPRKFLFAPPYKTSNDKFALFSFFSLTPFFHFFGILKFKNL